MAQLFVRHSLNSQKTVKFNIALRQFIDVDSEGELLWVVELGTTHLDSNGESIPPVYINKVSEDHLEDEVSKAIAQMCALIDWGPLTSDFRPPVLYDFTPTGDSVPMTAYVEFFVKDILPAAGIDYEGMKVILNNGDVDFDITSEVEITGDPYDYRFRWFPPKLPGNING